MTIMHIYFFHFKGSGQIRWCYSCPRPIFSSPTVLSNGDVLFGCVDGRVYIINSFGEQVLSN